MDMTCGWFSKNATSDPDLLTFFLFKKKMCVPLFFPKVFIKHKNVPGTMLDLETTIATHICSKLSFKFFQFLFSVKNIYIPFLFENSL